MNKILKLQLLHMKKHFQKLIMIWLKMVIKYLCHDILIQIDYYFIECCKFKNVPNIIVTFN